MRLFLWCNIRPKTANFPIRSAKKPKRFMQVYVNVALIKEICTEEATIIPTRQEYDDRLKQIVQKKCIDCVNYTEGDDLDRSQE